MHELSIRYIVDNVDEAIDFYSGLLGFEVRAHPGPGFALLQRDGLRLLVNTPAGGGGAGQRLSDGSLPEPGGWNRFQLAVDDLATTVDTLRGRGARFRGDIVTGRGGSQALLLDPAGNLVELFQRTGS